MWFLIETMYGNTDVAVHCVYILLNTNVIIALPPHFYVTVNVA